MSSNNKKPANPLLGVSHFKLEDSFGVQPTLVVPPVSSPVTSNTSSSALFKSNDGADPFSDVNLNGSSPLKPPTTAPPPVMSLGPPQPGLFLLPAATTSSGESPLLPPGPGANFAAPTSGAKPRSRYVPPPGIHSSSSVGNFMEMSQTPLQPPTLPPMGSVMVPSSESNLPSSSSVPDFSAMSSAQMPAVSQPSSTFMGGVIDEPVYHWYYKVFEKSHNVLNPAIDTSKITATWKPFSMRDSESLEHFYGIDKNTSVLIPTDGGRYDVDLPGRKKMPVYWKDGLNDEMEVRRASWFHKDGVNTWVPYDEELSARLESEYQSCIQTNQWKREIRITETNESIRIINPSMMFHLPSEHSSLSGKLDEWGQVQPPNQDPTAVPREVHRGVEGIIDEIADGEDMVCDHLVFVIHGIGGACDIKFRPIHEVVDSYRELTNNLSKKHFQRAHLTEQVTRVEFLPVNWHKPLHGQDTGTDQRLKPLTLKAIPKLRNFVNDTLLDILFYTSPIYCQSILDTVVSEINRLYLLFCGRNEDFKGKVSIMGHSLGSLIAFDLLSHQTTEVQEEHVVVEKPLPPSQDDLTLEQLFANLEISEYVENFTKEGIDMESLMLCNEDDLKEGGLPLGPRKKLLHYLDVRKAILEKKLSGLEEYQETSITSDVKYRIGPAGTGQPSVFYPRLDFEPASFYALGSPIALFYAVRGINNLGSKFSLPTCGKFFNIFHPYDPVAYRIESLINADYASMRPVTIPHHAGRKRMHLEIKDTVTKLMTGDLKKKLIDSVWSSLSAIYNTATGSATQSTQEKVLQEAMESKLQEQEELDSSNPTQMDAQLNSGQRIDFVLQEAPYESFNEYVFALGSHLCYWDSEDTSLMILKDIYEQILGVSSDEQLALAELNAAAMPPPPVVDNTPTAILRPPPTPMGAPMPSMPSMPAVAPSPILPEPPRDSTLVPPGSMMFVPMQPPAASSTPSAVAKLGPPPLNAAMGPPFSPLTTTSASIGPPPPMMPPSGAGGMTSANLSRPRRAAYPSHGVSNVPMGMDPTAPTEGNNASIGPPPTAGFMR